MLQLINRYSNVEIELYKGKKVKVDRGLNWFSLTKGAAFKVLTDEWTYYSEFAESIDVEQNTIFYIESISFKQNSMYGIANVKILNDLELLDYLYYTKNK